MWCVLYKSPLTWVKRSVSCLGAFPLDTCLEICLQKGSVFCIWKRASNLSVVKDLCVGSDVGMMSGVTCHCAVDWSDARHCWVWLLVLKAGPSLFKTDTMLIDADGMEGSSTRHDRQSAALFLAPEIHSNLILYVVSSNSHLFTLLLGFLLLRNFASGLWSFLMMMSVPWR